MRYYFGADFPHRTERLRDNKAEGIMANDAAQILFPKNATAHEPPDAGNAFRHRLADRLDAGQILCEHRDHENGNPLPIAFPGPDAAKSRRSRQFGFPAYRGHLPGFLPSLERAVAIVGHALKPRLLSPQSNSFFLLSISAFLGLQACGGGAPASNPSQSKVYAPEDMPEICQDIDFNRAGKEIKEQCGVQTRNYRAYKNIPEHRNLLLPKGAKIVRKGKSLELRLQSTLPIALPEDMEGKLLFDEKLRRTFVKSKLEYVEFFPENSAERLRILKLDIPLDAGGERSICYTVESRPTTAQRKAGFAGRLEPLDCPDFLRLKAVAEKANEEGKSNGLNPPQDSASTDGNGAIMPGSPAGGKDSGQ